MLLINKLAQAWDDFINDEEKLVHKRHHYFLLGKAKNSGGSEKKYASVKARNLNYQYRYDQRIIFIEVKNEKRRTLKKARVMSILHEVGHFIGNRNRRNKNGEKYNRQEAYVNLVTAAFCSQLHRLILSKAMKTFPKFFSGNIETNIYVNPRLKLLSFELRKTINIFYKDLHKEIKEKYFSKNNQEAIESGYLQDIEPVMIGVIREMLKKWVKKPPDWMGQLTKLLEGELKNNDSIIQEIFDEIERNLPQRDQREPKKSNYPWVESCGLLLQEIAADVFMLRIGEGNPSPESLSKYFLFIVDAIIDSLDEYSEEYTRKYKKEYDVPLHFIKLFMNNNIILPRMIAVQQAMDSTMTSVDFSVMEEFRAEDRFSKRSKARFVGLKLIDDILHKYSESTDLKGEDYDIQNIFNPLYEAVKYAKSIAHDNFDEYIYYSSVTGEAVKTTKNEVVMERAKDLQEYLKI